jgi:translocation and assembly module TamB
VNPAVPDPSAPTPEGAAPETRPDEAVAGLSEGTPPAAADPSSAAHAATAGGGRSRRWPRALSLLAWLALLVGLPLAAGWALLFVPRTLPLLLERLPGVQVEGVEGTLGEGRLRIARLQWQRTGDGPRLEIEQLALDGLRAARPTAAADPDAWLQLHWTRLTLGRLAWRSGPGDGQPPSLPPTLRLPLRGQALPVHIARLDIDTLPPVQDLKLSLTIGEQAGQRHRLTHLTARIDAFVLEADGTLGTDAPLPLALQLQLRPAPTAATTPTTATLDGAGTAAGPAVATSGGSGASARRPDLGPHWHVTLALDGPLARLQARARLQDLRPPGLRADAPALGLQADATLEPLAAWPLAALRLDSRQLDLSALRAGWPRTQLDIDARIDSRGLQAPVQLRLTLDNAAAGRIDRGALPLRQARIALQGRADQRDRLDVEAFDIQLHDGRQPAGRARGQGRWLGDRLALDIALQQLQPARLHQDAAALEISGPLTLRLSGVTLPGTPTAGGPAGTAPSPRLQLQATLDGRALDGSGLPVQLRLQAEADARQLELREALARAGHASARLQGRLRREAGGWDLRTQAALEDFDPLPWWKGGQGTVWRRGPHRLNAQLDADLRWRPPTATAADSPSPRTLTHTLQALHGQARLRMNRSLLAGVPLDLSASLDHGRTAADVEATAHIAGNRLEIVGRHAARAEDDRWQARADLDALPALAPLRELAGELAPGLLPWWPTAGTGQARLSVTGRWPALRTGGELQLRDLQSPALQIGQAQSRWHTGDSLDAPLELTLQASAVQLQGQTFERLDAQASGRLREHRLSLIVDSPLKPPAWSRSVLGAPGQGTRLSLQARGQWSPERDGGGRWQVQDLQLQGGARDEARQRVRAWADAQGLSGQLRFTPDGALAAAELAPGRLRLLTTALAWQQARWQAAPGLLQLQGTLETIDVSQWLARLQPQTGWGGSLRVGGSFDVRDAGGEDLRVEVALQRLGGDLTLTDDLGNTQGLGLDELRLRLAAEGGTWTFAQGLSGRNLGTITGAQVLRGAPGSRWPTADAPLDGVLQAWVDHIGVWSAWAPPGWRLAGQLRTTAYFGGTYGAPQVRGEMSGRQLSVRNVLQGVNLTDGDLEATLTGEQARIGHFSFRGGDGRLRLSGDASFGEQPQLRLKLAAERFRALGRIDRRIVASGEASAVLDRQALTVTGDIVVDEGLIDISQSGAPSLDADVRVRRPETPGRTLDDEEPAPASSGGLLRHSSIRLAVDLGEQLQLRGRGVDTTLRGVLQVSNPQGRLALAGTLRADGGRYAAYGQQLDLERGDITFTGATDNPRLDIQATRPNLDVVVGVAIGGLAQNPRVRLFSEPEMTEYEKLSWLVLGRAPEGLGRADTALLQRAALALLAGEDSAKAPTDELLGALGITDFSLRQTEGTVRETVVSLGRQLSRRWYLGYERSVNATTGTWQLIYRVAQRFTLRASSGEENALDAIWTWRW